MGKVESATNKTINVILVLIIVFSIMTGSAVAILSAANNVTNGVNMTINASNGEMAIRNLPLQGFFASGGIILIVVMIGVFILVMRNTSGKSK